jgi:hypothetical protein
MQKIVVDSRLGEKLTHGSGNIELTDEQGKVLGYFVSEESFDRIASAILPEPTREDLDQARREMLERGGLSTDQLLERMRATEREWKAR